MKFNKALAEHQQLKVCLKAATEILEGLRDNPSAHKMFMISENSEDKTDALYGEAYKHYVKAIKIVEERVAELQREIIAIEGKEFLEDKEVTIDDSRMEIFL